MANKKIMTAALFVANGLVYGLSALYNCFIQLYIEQYHTPVYVGILLAIGPFISILAPLFWGIRADRAKYKNTVIAVAVIGSAVFYYALKINTSFIWLFVSLTLLMFFMSPFGGLIDTITLEYTSANNIAYGPIRLMGTLVYGTLSMVMSIFTEKNINIIFYTYAALAVMCAAAIFIMPRVSGHSSAGGKTDIRTDIRSIFKYKRLLMMFVLIGICQFTWAYYLNFYPTYMTNTLGLSQRIWGVTVFLTVAGEIPFFIMFSRIFKRFGLKHLLMFGVVLSILRYSLLAFASGAISILLTGLITGLCPTILTYCGSVYINKNISDSVKASGQTLMYALALGIPKVLAGVCGGFMTDIIGVPSSMMICAVISVISLGIYFVFIHRDNSEEYTV